MKSLEVAAKSNDERERKPAQNALQWANEHYAESLSISPSGEFQFGKSGPFFAGVVAAFKAACPVALRYDCPTYEGILQTYVPDI